VATRKSAKSKAAKSSARKSSRKASSSRKSSLFANGLTQRDPDERFFTPDTLDKTVIAMPLLQILEEEEEKLKKNRRLRPRLHPVIIDLNLEYPRSRDGARKWVVEKTNDIINRIGRKTGKVYVPDANKRKRQGEKESDEELSQEIDEDKSEDSEQYLFGRLEAEVIRELVRRDAKQKEGEQGNETIGATVGARAIYHIWPDFPVKLFINKSVSTVKADAARVSFSAYGEGIVWAVLDSGIDEDHPHFRLHKNLELEPPLRHQDFSRRGTPEDREARAKRDGDGHGTHVAGIIAGEMRVPNPDPNQPQEILAYARHRNERGRIKLDPVKNLTAISGMAPRCKLLSMRVTDEAGNGQTSSLIAAIARIQKINGYGRRLLIHGVNMSLGYEFEPEWFACGQSPLCVEVDRLVRSGVVVVVSAGNSGYGRVAADQGVARAGLDMTIDDPGNAELAITVGSTHRDSPHIYGVSYFSSKGPTGDGRIKPDLVAPGEKILSCAAGRRREEMEQLVGGDCHYLEQSGTSMAAPHVSGIIAAFLSVRREFIGQPERVKEIFLSTTTDLKRERYFQGSGLVDLMRAIQSV
jgi:subtilisin family serine protease